MNEPSHAEIVRALGSRMDRSDGRREERDKAVDQQFDAGRNRMSAIETRIAGLEITAAETKVTVESVKETGEATAAKVDRLVSVLDQSRGAAWAFLKVWGGVIVVIGVAGTALAWLATNLAAVKKFLGMGD